MRRWLVVLCIFLGGWCVFIPTMEAKKIKNSFRIDKEKKTSSKGEEPAHIEGVEINLTDSLCSDGQQPIDDPRLMEVREQLRKCYFSGYDKEISSNVESFILTNTIGRPIKGFKVRIDYLDMQGRMLNSRTVRLACDVPPAESRRFDIKGWDKQHTYYYYLGNQPKRVATPFQVTFYPLSFWIEE